jgi:hypothetical protein
MRPNKPGTSDLMKRGLCIGRLLFAFVLPAILSVPLSGQAASTASGFVAAEADTAGEIFWTPHRFINAAPMAVTSPAGFTPAPLAAAPPAARKSAGGRGTLPTVWIPPQPDDLVHAPLDLDRIAPADVVRDSSFGSGVFTESRVIPPGAGQSAAAVAAYPYRAVGKLFFHDPRTGQDFFCGAATNGARVIVTAAQCVTRGSSGCTPAQCFYNSFVFIPAFDNGAAPYRAWSGRFLVVSNAWLLTGFLPNPADFALIEVADQGGMTLGSAVGTLGWQTNRLRFNHFTTLGYACNLDACMLMQRNDAQTSFFGGNSTWGQGSNFGSGAAGGPWVQDFGLNPTLAASAGNRIVAVTSYLPASGVGFIGASQFDQLFNSMRNYLCRRQPGNC